MDYAIVQHHYKTTSALKYIPRVVLKVLSGRKCTSFIIISNPLAALVAPPNPRILLRASMKFHMLHDSKVLYN